MSDMRDQDDLNLNKTDRDQGGNTLERDRVTRGEVGENDLDLEKEEDDDLSLEE